MGYNKQLYGLIPAFWLVISATLVHCDDNDGELSTEAIVGIVIGTLIFVVLVIVIYRYYVKRKKRRQSQTKDSDSMIMSSADTPVTSQEAEGHVNVTVAASGNVADSTSLPLEPPPTYAEATGSHADTSFPSVTVEMMTSRAVPHSQHTIPGLEHKSHDSASTKSGLKHDPASTKSGLKHDLDDQSSSDSGSDFSMSSDFARNIAPAPIASAPPESDID